MHNTKPLVALLAIITLGIFLPACSKDDDNPKTKTDLLTTGSWHVTAYTVDPAVDWDGDGTDDSNIYSIMDPCIKDDNTTFAANGSGTLDEGGSKCDPSDPQQIPLLWSFKQNETQLEIEGILYTIQTLSESQLIVTQIDIIQGVTYTHTVSFSH